MKVAKRGRVSRAVIMVGLAALITAAAITTVFTAKYVKEIRIPCKLIIDTGLAKSVACVEHEATRRADGVYTLDAEKETDQSEFILMPGVDAARDPFVKIEGKNSVPVYVYVEVVSSLDEKLSFEPTEDWLRLEGAQGANGGPVYAYRSTVDDTFGADQQDEGQDDEQQAGEQKVIVIKLMKEDKVTVSHTYIAGDSAEAELSFYPYMAKAEEGKTAQECFDKKMIGFGDTGRYFPAPKASVSISDGKAIVGKTGYSVYVRAAVAVNWKDAEGNILAKAPAEGTDYTFSTGTGWFKAADGYYYYSDPVESEGATDPLVSGFAAKGEAPGGYTLSVDISAEVIQQAGWTDEGSVPAVTEVWGCTVGEDGKIAKQVRGDDHDE